MHLPDRVLRDVREQRHGLIHQDVREILPVLVLKRTIDRPLQADHLHRAGRPLPEDLPTLKDLRSMNDRLFQGDRPLRAEATTEVKEIVIQEVVRERVQVLRILIVVRKRIQGLRIPVAVRQVVVRAQTVAAAPVGTAIPAVVPAEGTYPADQQKEAHLQKVREATATEVLLPVLQKEEAAQEDKTYSFINKLLLLSGRRTGLRRFAD
jgi:hypothetical protein